MLKFAIKYKPDAIIHAGDAKEQYSPIDVRVPKFWIKAISQITKAGFRFIMLLGNHDRISQSRESKNWLDILRVAGAETVSIPKWKKVANGSVAFLPFTSDKKLELQWSNQLADDAPAGHKALIFHTGIRGANISAYAKDDTSITVDQLHSDVYDICLGGHYHEHQNITGSNVYYVGSPFCQDWSEANQTKGHVLVDVNDKVSLKQLKTKIPGWYTVDWLEQHNITPEPGSLIKSVVSVTNKKIRDQLKAEEQRLKAKYPDASIIIKSKIEQADKAAIDLGDATDQEKIERYVAVTSPDNARFKDETVTSYLLSRLQAVGYGQASGGYISFKRCTGKNVLSFPEIDITYSNHGVVLLHGVNHDWDKRSNGAGKTGVLSLLTIALFGQTLKGQKHDAWASEGSDKPASVTLTLRDSKNRLIEITRGRRPHSIALRIDNIDESSGIRGTGREETQGRIEKATGYDLNLLLNSVYIDQTIANGFVFGTQKDRMDLVGKLQNLERFDLALKLVSRDIIASDKALSDLSSKIESFEDDIARIEDDLKDVTNQVEVASTNKLIQAKKKVSQLTEEREKLVALSDLYLEKNKELEALQQSLELVTKKHVDAIAKVKALEKQYQLGVQLQAAGNCPTCQQPSSRIGSDMQISVKADLLWYRNKVTLRSDKLKALNARIKELWVDVHDYQSECKCADTELQFARMALSQAEESAAEEAIRNSKLNAKRRSLSKELFKIKRFLHASRETEKQLSIDREMLEYARKALSRSGIPLYLCAALCPVLNAAAEEYADIFYDGKLQVHFEVVSGEFEVSIVNPSGSESLSGQSVGESAMAGIIAAFAIREVAPKTNILLIDEPGHGLDEAGARRFANGLLRLKNKFDTIVVTTHSPAIESILSGETTWTVEKRNGISRLVQ